MWRFADGSPWAQTARSNEAYYVRIIGFADFRIAPSRVEVGANPGARESTIRHLLLDQVLPLSLAAEGHLVLHASAVQQPGVGTIALAGGAGAGKSTLAAALRLEGWNVTSDDGVLVREDADGIVAVPAYPGLRLWPDAAAATALTDHAVSEVAEYSAKLRVSTMRADPGGESPLRGVYVIEQDGHGTIQKLGRRDAAVALMRHAYPGDLDDRRAIVAQLETCARVAERVPVWRASVARDLARLPHTARALSAHATVGDS